MRLTLGGLILLVLVTGLCLGWLVRGVRIQREAVAAIRFSGGTVEYDCRYDGATRNPAGAPWAPTWMVSAFGIDTFSNVVQVRLPTTSSDVDLENIARLPGLIELNVAGAPISNKGMKHLEWLVRLRKLNLNGTNLSDTGLAHLKRLTHLEELDLGNTRVTDAGLAHLNQFDRLEVLQTQNSRVSYDGVRAFYASGTHGDVGVR
jgi:hypothetical protein